MTGPLTGFLKIPVATSLPCQLTSLGNPTFTDKIFMILQTARDALRSLALQRNGEWMQFCGHESGDYRRIAFHELTRGRFIFCLKDCDPECLVAGFTRPAGQDQFPRFDRVFES